jgi:hypothetical protein
MAFIKIIIYYINLLLYGRCVRVGLFSDFVNSVDKLLKMLLYWSKN